MTQPAPSQCFKLVARFRVYWFIQYKNHGAIILVLKCSSKEVYMCIKIYSTHCFFLYLDDVMCAIFMDLVPLALLHLDNQLYSTFVGKDSLASILEIIYLQKKFLTKNFMATNSVVSNKEETQKVWYLYQHKVCLQFGQ